MFSVRKKGRLVALSNDFWALAEIYGPTNVIYDDSSPDVETLEETFIGPAQACTPNAFRPRPDLLKAGHWRD